jgi:hypothetical protein
MSNNTKRMVAIFLVAVLTVFYFGYKVLRGLQLI